MKTLIAAISLGVMTSFAGSTTTELSFESYKDAQHLITFGLHEFYPGIVPANSTNTTLQFVPVLTKPNIDKPFQLNDELVVTPCLK